MTTATRNAFNYGMTESLAGMTLPAILTAARWAVLAYDVATCAEARRTYRWVGSMTIALGQLAFWSAVWCYAKAAAWAEGHVQASLNADLNADHIPDAGNMVEPNHFVSTNKMVRPATMATPVAVRVVPIGGATVTSAELRRQCQAAGIRWRNAHGKGRHLTKTEMIAALALS